MKVNRKQLLSSLLLVKPGLEDKEQPEQPICFLFNGGNIYTYNGEVAIAHQTNLTDDFIILAKELIEVLIKLPDEEIELNIREKELIIRGERRIIGIMLQSDKMLTVPDELKDAKKDWKNLPNNFSEAIRFCITSASRDAARSVLTCLNISKNYIESCNDFCLSHYILDSTFDNNFLLPARSVEKLPDYITTKYSLSTNWAHFKNDAGTIFSVRLDNGVYPDLSHLINRTGKKIKFPVELDSALERAAIFYDKDNKTISIAISKDEGLNISTLNDNGWIRENLKIDSYEGDEIKFQVKPDSLRAILSKFSEAEIDEKMVKFSNEKFIYCCATEMSK